MTAVATTLVAVAVLFATYSPVLARGGDQGLPATDGPGGIVVVRHLDTTVIIGLIVVAQLYRRPIRDANQGRPTHSSTALELCATKES